MKLIFFAALLIDDGNVISKDDGLTCQIVTQMIISSKDEEKNLHQI
jgi:hypothetical protein